MGYYCIITKDSVQQGKLETPEANNPKLSMNIVRQNDVLRSATAFQLILLSYDPTLENPNRIIMISPERYTYVEFDRDAFRYAVMNSGLHRHNTYELVYIREGLLYQRIEAERHMYPARSFVLLNRNVRHTEEYDTAFSTVSLSLSEEFFKELLLEDRAQELNAARLWGENTDLKEFLSAELTDVGSRGKNYLDFIPNLPYEEETDPVREQFEKIAEILLVPQAGDTFFLKGYICRLLNLLCRQELFTTRPIALGTEAETRIFSQISQLINESSGRVTREELVRSLRYSGSYLNRIVRTFTGMNITQYSMSCAINRAAQLLSSTNLTVTEIIMKLGFSNRGQFYSEFEDYYGLTPREYRLQHSKY